MFFKSVLEQADIICCVETFDCAMFVLW